MTKQNKQQQSGINEKEAMKAIVAGSKKLHASFLELTDVNEDRKGLIADELQKLFVQQLRIANGIGVEKDLKASTELGKKFATLAAGSMPAKNYKLFDDLHLEIMIGLSKVFQDHMQDQAAGGKKEKTKKEGKASGESDESKKARQARQKAEQAKQQARKTQAAKAWDAIRNITPADLAKNYDVVSLADVKPDDIVSNADCTQCYRIFDAGKRGIQITSFVVDGTTTYYSLMRDQFTAVPDRQCYAYTEINTGNILYFKFYRAKKTA